MQDFMEDIESSTKKLQRGDLVDGKVLQVGDDHIIADISYAQDGVVQEGELVKAPGDYQVDAEVYLIVIGFNEDGQVILSEKKAQKKRGEKLLQEAEANGTYVEGKLVATVKGGFRVDVSGVRGYLPFSLYQKNYLNNPEELVGQMTELAIEKNDKRGYVFTRMPIANAIFEREKATFYAAHKVGDTIEGTIQSFNRGGVVADVAGMRGFIPRSEVSYSRSTKAEDVVKKGDVVSLIIKELKPADNQLILSYKETKGDPWQNIAQHVQAGEVFERQPVGENKHLYFYELADGVQGSLEKDRVPEDVIENKKDHTIVVMAVDARRRRVDLDFYDESTASAETEAEEEHFDNTLGSLFGDELKKLKFD